MSKIGIDCRLWNETGVGRYIRNLVWELAKIDTKQEYVLFFKENEFNNVQLPGANFRKVKADIHWHTFKEQLFMPVILLKERLDLVHIPYFNVPIFYPGKFITTSHDLTILHYNTGKASTLPYVLYLIRRIGYYIDLFVGFHRARKIISVSHATKEEIIDNFHINVNKIKVILEGVDEKIQATHSSSIKHKYLLYVGNAYPHKNLERLIEAFSLLKKRNREKDLKLILVGKEDYFYKRLKQIVLKKDLQEEVLFYEKVSDAGLANLYKHALCLVAPSLMEGFGLPLVEAMQYGALVACSDIPVFREIGGDVPLYFSPDDPSSIAQVLEQVVTDKIKEKKERKEKGMKRASEFSWTTMALETKEIYESCIGIR